MIESIRAMSQEDLEAVGIAFDAALTELDQMAQNDPNFKPVVSLFKGLIPLLQRKVIKIIIQGVQ